MPQLIRIGNTIINLAHVWKIEIEGESLISVYVMGGRESAPVQFLNEEAASLLSVLEDVRFVYSTGPADLTCAVIG